MRLLHLLNQGRLPGGNSFEMLHEGSLGGGLSMPSLKRQNSPLVHKNPSLQATPTSSFYLLKLERDRIGPAVSQIPPSLRICKSVAAGRFKATLKGQQNKTEDE